MNENIDFKFDEKQFLTAKEKLGYSEENIILTYDDSKENVLLNYSLSNSIDDIEIAIFNRTGLKLKLEKAKWALNLYLSINVKQLMNKHQVSFSMTTYYEEKTRIITMNMRVADNWFITKYVELNGKCYQWDYFDTLEKLKRFIEHYLSSETDENEEDD